LKVAFLIQKIWINKLIFYFAVLAGCVLAFSPAEMGLQPQLNDKLLHTVGFFIMAVLCHLAHPFNKHLILAIGLALLGLGIEIIQAYLPYRSFSLWDWVADISGVLFYFLIIARFLKYKDLLD